MTANCLYYELVKLVYVIYQAGLALVDSDLGLGRRQGEWSSTVMDLERRSSSSVGTEADSNSAGSDHPSGCYGVDGDFSWPGD